MMKMIGRLFCCLLAGFGLAGAEPDAKGFIADWLLAGPFPSYENPAGDTGLATDFLGGEALAKPWPGWTLQTVFKVDEAKKIGMTGYVNEWGRSEDLPLTVVWRAERFPQPERILADKLFPPIEDRFAFYAACYIESPADREIKVRLGSDDDHKVWLNGALLGQSATSQAIKPDSFIYRARLRAGLNLLLLKVVDRLFDSGFCLALSDAADRPLEGLKIHTDSPARAPGVDNWANGFGAKFDFPAGTLYDDRGEQHCILRFLAPDAGRYSVELGGERRELKNGDAVRWPLALKAGRHELRAVVRDGKGKVLADLPHDIVIHSRPGLEKRRLEIGAERKQLEARLPLLDREIAAAREQVAAARAKVDAAVAEVEKRYAAARAEAAKNASSSIDEPFQPAALRSRLLLNGVWRAGFSEKKLDRTYRLPHNMTGPFYRRRFYPVVPDPPSNTHAKAWKPLEGYEGYAFDELFTAPLAVFETDVEIDDPAAGWSFLCTAVVGRLKLWCNGEASGEYHGSAGLVELPLKALRPGKNTLRLEFTQTSFVKRPDDRFYGILGDLYLERRSPIHIADVWVRPSWRQSSLRLVTELINPAGREVSYRLEQYAVKDGRVRYRLPVLSGTLKPGLTTLSAESAWRDPELWSLESPALYQLVSDLYLDGKPVDRKSETFGFREFWIHGVDFFFNGRRIILQGDVGITSFGIEKARDVLFPLLRQDGINTLRLHDSQCHMLPEVPAAADRYGMFIMAQLYPMGDFRREKDSELMTKFGTFSAWQQSDWHRFNRDNYRRWHRAMRNHPSIIIWSVDNELFTPGCESRGLEKRNELVDDIVHSYLLQMREQDPELVLTRDGDVSTYGPDRRNFDPGSPANIHYPEFHKERFVHDWQRLFQYRPALFGETLYCSYVWGGWPGAQPRIVAQKSKLVRDTARLYRELGIPALIYMGVGLDGFLELKPDGSGNPWGVIEVPYRQTRPENWRNGMAPNHYPFMPIGWPSSSGRGMRPEFENIDLTGWGFRAVNWMNPDYRTCVRNAVNDAYRDTLIPQPPLAEPGTVEAILRSEPGAAVFTTLRDGSRYGVRADAEGLAWFHLDAPGTYRFEAAGRTLTADLTKPRDYAARPGFNHIPRFDLK